MGFLAAVFNNGIDCVQNVFSKKLLSSHYNYVNLQAARPTAATPPGRPPRPLRLSPRACPAPLAPRLPRALEACAPHDTAHHRLTPPLTTPSPHPSTPHYPPHYPRCPP